MFIFTRTSFAAAKSFPPAGQSIPRVREEGSNIQGIFGAVVTLLLQKPKAVVIEGTSYRTVPEGVDQFIAHPVADQADAQEALDRFFAKDLGPEVKVVGFVSPEVLSAMATSLSPLEIGELRRKSALNSLEKLILEMHPRSIT